MKSLGEYVQDNEHLKNLILGNNEISDNGVKILAEHLIGNSALQDLDLSFNNGITNTSIPFLLEIAKTSSIESMNLQFTSIDPEMQQEIWKFIQIPVVQREIPIKSNAKSAAKVSLST